MATTASTWQGYVLGGSSNGVDLGANDPVDTGIAWAVANNIAHVCDEAAQVRVCFTAPGAAYALTVATPITATGVYYRILSMPFFASERADGTPYRFRVRIAGAISQAGQTATYRLAICALGVEDREIIDADTTNVLETTATVTTAAWLTPATTLLSLPLGKTNEAVTVLSVIDDISGTTQTTTGIWLSATVWAKTTSTAANPELHGLLVAEYIGTT